MENEPSPSFLIILKFYTIKRLENAKLKEILPSKTYLAVNFKFKYFSSI